MSLLLTLPLLLGGLPAHDSITSARVIHLSAHSQSAMLWTEARKKIKHVFVIYQENECFDHYFGTFPGADGLFTHSAAETPGFYQPVLGIDGKPKMVHPYRIPLADYPADTDDRDHGHDALVSKMDIVDGVPHMDRFAMGEQASRRRNGPLTLRSVQQGELAMAYIDGNTIPLLWRYASRFVLCDHIFQNIAGPSTPGNLAIIGAQSGATQWMLHPDEAPGKSPYGGVPVLNDANPYWGSSLDTNVAGKMPYNPFDNPKHKPQLNLTFATLPLSLTRGDAATITDSDNDKEGDLRDVLDDVSYLTKNGKSAIPWGWYEEGFDKEPNDVKSSDPVDATGTHASYVTHHNGPQYFGYIANNPKMATGLHGLNDLYTAIQGHTLPSEGVFYVKGGYENIMGMHPACPDPRVQKNFVGDDDHPGYSDAQISEAMVARTINMIAKSPYWKDSVIIVTWDDSEGDYDHVRPPMIALGPDGKLMTDGPRVPMLVISPFSKTHTVFHGVGDQGSVVKFVDHLFGLTPLADLPDELKGRKIGEKMGLKNEGPVDDLTPDVSDLLGALDPARLSGKKKPLPASYVLIPSYLVDQLPSKTGYGLKQLGIITTDRAKHIKNVIPSDFNPRPDTTPTKTK